MKSQSRRNVTGQVVASSVAMLLAAFGIAQNRAFAVGNSSGASSSISVTKVPDTPFSRHALASGLIRANYGPIAPQQLIDDIVCDGRITDGGWGQSDPTAFYFPAIPPAPVTFGGSSSQDRFGHSAGQQQYVDHNDVDAFDVHSTLVTDVACMDSPLDVLGGRAVIQGQARVTKLTTLVDLIENFTIILDDIADGGRGRDTYQIQLVGAFMYDSGQVVLRGGNIQVRR